MLWSPEAHEPLVDDAWDPEAARTSIRGIAAGAETAFDDVWPAHPLDEPEPLRFRSTYLGSAGVIGALHELERRSLVELRRDYVSFLQRDPSGDEPPPSLLLGETGVRLVLQRLAPSDENLARL